MTDASLSNPSVGTQMSTILDTAFRFRRNLRGNVTLFFAVSLPVLVLAIGVSIDFGRAAAARTQLNSAADAAALAALTPAMLQQSASVAQAAAVDMFNGQTSAINGLVAGQTTVTVTISNPASNPVVRQVTVTFAAQVQNFFAAIEPSATFSLGGTSVAQASVPPNVDFYLLLDNSPSMSLPATTAGVNTMQNLTPDQGSCALACHQASTNNSDTADNPCWNGAVYTSPTLASPPPSTKSGHLYCAASQGAQIDDYQR